MKKIIFLLLISFQSFSQNLVPNYSFEDTIPCSINPSFGSVETAAPWVTANGSPDYASSIYCGGIGVPFGFQAPNTGHAIVGISIYINAVLNGGREAIEVELIDSLKFNHIYCVSFYASLAEQGQYASNNLGAYFSVNYIDDVILNSFSINPQIKSDSIISDTLNWTLITGNFIAQGGEKYITIGNLLDDANTLIDTMPWGNPSPAYAFAYYYIDDVSVTDCTVGINNINPATTQIKLYPNPAKQTQAYYNGTLATNQTGNLQVTDMLGNILATYNLCSGSNKIAINTAPYAKGVYVVKVNVVGMARESLKLVVE